MAFATREKVIVNPARRRKFGRKAKANRAAHRPRSRRNAGEIVSYVLNPGSARRKAKMATPKKKRRRRYGSARHRTAQANPGRRRRVRMRGNPRRRYGRARRNPGGMSVSDLLMSGIFATAGAVGSKLLTQAVLGSNNTGVIGYAGNAAAGIALGLAAGMTAATRKHAAMVYVGTIVGLVIRVISDYTSYGSALALSGMGDYQVANFVTPQRYVDGLHTSEIQVPNGWGGGTAVIPISSAGVPASHAASAAAAGLSGMYDVGCGDMYAIN